MWKTGNIRNFFPNFADIFVVFNGLQFTVLKLDILLDIHNF